MNRRIQQLAEQAKQETSLYGGKPGDREFDERFNKMFAELIVRECADVAVFKGSGMIATADVAGYMAAGRSTAARLIKEHFGVEE